MKQVLFFLPISLILFLVAFNQDVAQSNSVTTTKNSKLLLSGNWQSNKIYNNSFVNGKLLDQQQSEAVETYSFLADDSFSLTQGTFSIEGKWMLDKDGSQVIVTTESGEELKWQIQALSHNQLKLFRSETIQVGSKAHRLETLVNCTRILQ